MLHFLTPLFIHCHYLTCTSIQRISLTRLLILLSLALTITACATNTLRPTAESTSQEKATASELFHQDSTVYFADKKASVSLRASFIQETTQSPYEVTTQSLMNGYKLQFRSILKGNNVIEKVSIIAGGKKITLLDKPLFIQENKGLIINSSKEEALFIMDKSDATLRFKFNQQSYLMSLRNHTLSEFIVP